MMLTKEIIENIEEFKSALEKANDGVAATKKVAEAVIAQVQGKFQEYSGTQSVDERIKILVDSSQGCVKIVEDFHNDLEKQVNDLKLQISTLETLLDRVSKYEDDAGQQNISIEDEGEKKSEGEGD